MFGIGTGEMIIIAVIVLIIFGPGKLPQIGSALGKGIMNFKTGMAGVDHQKKALDGKASEEQSEEQKKLE